MEPKELAGGWDDHNAAEFASKDVEAAMRTMVEDPHVRIMANGAGGRGQEQVRAFYADVLIPQWPDDAQMQPVNRVVGEDQLVDELRLSFMHAKQMDWLLPGVPPSNRSVEMDVVIVAQFRDSLVAGERIYWDHAAVLRQGRPSRILSGRSCTELLSTRQSRRPRSLGTFPNAGVR